MNKTILATLMSALLVSAALAGIKPASASDGSLNISWTLLDNSLAPGAETTLLLTVTNPNAEFVYNVNLNFAPALGLTVTPSSFGINSISPNNSQYTSVRIIADENATIGSSYVELDASYQVGSTKATAQNITIWIPVNLNTSPDLVIEDLKYDKTVIQAGGSATISFNVKNYGNGPAKDVKVSMDSTASIFTVDLSEKYIAETLPVNASAHASFSLRVQPSLSEGTYSFPITLNYKNDTGNQVYTVNKFASIDIYGNFNLLVTVLSSSRGTVTIKIANAGTLEAIFLEVRILSSSSQIRAFQENQAGVSQGNQPSGFQDNRFGAFTNQVVASPNYIYVGNLQPNDYDTEDITFQFGENTRGNVPVNFELIYQDLFGNKFAENKTVMITAFSATSFPSSPSSGNNTLYFLIGAIVVVAIPTGYFLRRRRKKRSQA